MITIIDYGVGNLRSVEKAFTAVDAKVEITSDKDLLMRAKSLVLPGVGAFGEAMDCLRSKGFDQIILSAAKMGKPILGVCLGYQLLFEESEEFGLHKGLGLLPGRVVRFPKNDLHVPHVGWNQVHKQQEHPILDNIPSDSFFYFVHSFYVEPRVNTDVIGLASYGVNFCAIAARDNVMGVQFHPEKSQQAGLTLLKNFYLQLK